MYWATRGATSIAIGTLVLSMTVMSTLSSLAVDAVQPVQIEVNLGQVEVSTSYVMRAGTEQVQFEAGAIRLTNAVSEHPDPLTLHVAGANEQVRIDPVSPLPARTHYLIGDDPGRFIIDVPAYKELVYRGIYPGIDLVVRGADSRIELEYLLAAGADRTVLLLDLQGVQRLDFEATGGVLLATATRTIHLLRPTVEVSPAAAPLDATFVRVGTSLGIAIAGASSEVPVRLRTAIELSGPSASSLSESILGAPQVARDASGHLWVVGRVASAQESQRTDRANYFVAKLDPSGREVLQTTFLGSSANEIPHALAITTLGEIVVAGQSTPLDSGNPDIFVTRLAPDARSVISQAVFGGSGTDVAHALITDANGSAWIAGNTTSSDFPVSDSGAQRSPGGEGDAFVAKLDRSGGIRFASYLGGTASDDAAGLAVDSRGAIYVSGTTRSTNFPQAIYISPAQTGSADAFVVKLDPVHGSLAFSTVLGGSDDDRAIAIVAGDAPEVVIAGTTRSNDFPIIDGQQPMSGGGADAFVCRIDAISGALRSATYLGGAGDEYIEALARDRSGRVMIVGSSNSNDFGAARLSRRSLGGGRDAFVARVELRSAERLRVMLLGGEGDDDASEVALDANGGAVLVGLTKSTNFATASRLMSSPDGDVFTASVGAENDGPLGSCPGTKQWVGGTSNAWENSLNWSGGTLPGGGDDVCIQGAAVVLGTGAQSAASLRVDGGGSLTINAGTLTIAGASEINGNLTINGGTLAGTGNVTVSGTLTWTGGTMTGAGTTTANGPLNISGAAVKDLTSNRIFNNNLIATWTGTGGIRIGTGAVLNNNGTWDAQNDSAISIQFTGPAAVNNVGTFKKSAGTGSTSISINFNNTGTVLVQSGTLSVSGGGNSSAAFNVASAAATMQFAGSAYDLNAGTTFVGPGTALSTGTLNVNTAIGIPATMTFTMTGGIVQGTGTLTTAGTLNWSGGTMTGAGTTTANGPFNISGAAVKDLTSSRILNNNLIATWTGTGGIRIGTGAVLNNDGTWDAQNDSAISIQFTGPAAVNNVGTFKKSAGTGSTAISINFNNSGTVDIQTGTLSLSSSNFSQTAGVTQLTGGALVSTTNLNFLGGRLAGSGTITAPVIVSGTAALTPGLSPGTLNLVGDYTQQAPSGAFNVEIAGTNPGTGYDRLNISGVGSNAELAGVLNVSLSSGFTPNSTDSFTVMTYPTRTGNYVLNLPAAGCLGWVVDYGATALTLSLVDVPVQLQGLMIAANKSDLTWAAPPINPATLYDVVRGGLAQLPVGSTANETCIARGIGERTASDPGRPGAGQGFWYLVRERVPGCANGTYGFASNGTERSTSTCP